MKSVVEGRSAKQGERVRQERLELLGKDIQLPSKAYENAITYKRKVEIACQLTEFMVTTSSSTTHT